MRGRTWSWLPWLVLTAGCWGPRYFEPREHKNGTGPDGDSAAVYSVDAHAGAAKGEVRVWSHGARALYAAEDDADVVDLYVGFEIENNGKEPLELEAANVQCDQLSLDGRPQPPLSALHVFGTRVASPGSTTRVDLVFRPPTTRPRDIDSFSVRFAVRADEDEVLSQVTPFTPVRFTRGYYYGSYWGSPYWGWGPYWGGGWGYRGYGFGGFRGGFWW